MAQPWPTTYAPLEHGRAVPIDAALLNGLGGPSRVTREDPAVPTENLRFARAPVWRGLSTGAYLVHAETSSLVTPGTVNVRWVEGALFDSQRIDAVRVARVVVAAGNVVTSLLDQRPARQRNRSWIFLHFANAGGIPVGAELVFTLPRPAAYTGWRLHLSAPPVFPATFEIDLERDGDLSPFAEHVRGNEPFIDASDVGTDLNFTDTPLVDAGLVRATVADAGGAALITDAYLALEFIT